MTAARPCAALPGGISGTERLLLWLRPRLLSTVSRCRAHFLRAKAVSAATADAARRAA